MSVALKFHLVVTENEKEICSVRIGQNELDALIGYLADIPANAPLFDCLTRHPAAEVRKSVAQKNQLSMESILSLAQDPDREVQSYAMRREKFSQSATLEQLRDLIDSDVWLAREVARNIDEFSGVDLGELCALLIAHPDPGVAMELADGYSTPKNVLRSLLKHPELSVSCAAEEKLAN